MKNTATEYQPNRAYEYDRAKMLSQIRERDEAELFALRILAFGLAAIFLGYGLIRLLCG